MINPRSKSDQNNIKLVPADPAATDFINRRKRREQDPTKKRAMPLYLPPQLEAEVVADAKANFMTRNAWITEACRFYLRHRRSGLD
jgi:hypothetical protein